MLRIFPIEEKKGKKGTFNMEEQEKTQGHLIKGFLIGGFLGAMAGLFFAPKSGKELRSAVRELKREFLRDGEKFYSDVSADAKEIIEEAKHQAKDLKQEGDRHLSETRQKVKEITARGEKKVPEAKNAKT